MATARDLDRVVVHFTYLRTNECHQSNMADPQPWGCRGAAVTYYVGVVGTSSAG